MKRKLTTLVIAVVVSSLVVWAPVAAAASSPTVRTGAHSHVTDSSAVLHGTVDPNGRATTYYFQWGPTTAYGVNSVAHSAGRGTKAASVSATATGLIPGTVYHYRLVATNRAGLTVGADRTFKTRGNPPPTVATGPASQVHRNGVTLTAVVAPNKQATSWYFQYGTSTAYPSQTIPAVVPAGTAPVTVAWTVPGLEARTIFHYRVVAMHSNTLPQVGLDSTFMTLPRHRPVPRIHATTKPAHARHRPFVLTTSGAVKGPRWIPGIYDCRGNVAVHFLLGRRQVSFALVPLQPNCHFAGQTIFNRLPRHRGRHRPLSLTVKVRYLGNGYLTPRRAGTETVKLG